MKIIPDSRNRVFGLDLMRAVAIIMVLLAHCIWIFPQKEGPLSQLMALFGFLGVEIFFVLSGFLIGRILYRNFTTDAFDSKAMMRFLKRRWFRTLPNYLLILMVNLLIACFIGYTVDQPWRYFLFIHNFASPLPGFFPESWSLSVEEFAYVFLPLALLPFGRRSGKSRTFLLITLLLILISIAAKFNFHFNNEEITLDRWNIALKSVVVYRVDAIFIGVLCSWIYSEYVDQWRRIRWISAMVGIVMMAFFTVGVAMFQLYIDQYPIFWNVVYLPAASISIAFFLPILTEWRTANRYIAKPVRFISLISYSIYLLHYSVILQTLKQVVTTENLDHASRIAFTCVYLFITIAMSTLLYRYFERPFMEMRERF